MKSEKFNRFAVICTAFVLFVFGQGFGAESARVKNVILCIGDGMGPNQILLAKSYKADGELCFEKLPVTGSITTYSANRSVTDSAAAATALATGFKTKNGMVGLTPDKEKCQTILEAAKANGMRTGLVVTSSITDATPACFACHVKSRKMQTEIAEQLISSKVDVLLGGGEKFFLPHGIWGSERKDEDDLIAKAKADGYQYVRNGDELAAADGERLLGLFASNGLKTKELEPSLPEMTSKAIEVLSDSNSGFFLLVEGSQIDWACHNNNTDEAIKQTLLFDQAVKKVIDFAAQDGQTLVIVTADHETGGLKIKGGQDGKKLKAKWSTRGHSGIPVRLFAFGPGAEDFGGVYDNTLVPKKIAKRLNLELGENYIQALAKSK